MEPSAYVTAREAADLLGVGYRTIFRWIATGRIHGEKVAVNRWAIRRASLPGHRPTLAERVGELERLVDELIAQREGVIIPTTPPRPSDGHPTRTYTPPDADEWPTSARGRARILAALTGRSETTARDWVRSHDWQTRADALAWLAARGAASATG